MGEERSITLQELLDILKGKKWNVENCDDADIHFNFQNATIEFDPDCEELTISSGRCDRDDSVEVRVRVTDVFTNQSLVNDITIEEDGEGDREIIINFSNDDFWNISEAITYEETQKRLKAWEEEKK